MITRRLSTGEQILIFDSVFPATKVVEHEVYANKCNYSLIHITDPFINSRPYTRFFGSVIDDAGLNEFNILQQLPDQIKVLLKNKRKERSWILSGNHSTQYSYHVDSNSNNSFTLLIYLNSLWHPEWGGETLFCNIYGEPEIAVAQKANRVVIFPADLNHKPSQITVDAPYRFTFTATFTDGNNDV